jgi:hypothetical protein
MVQLTQRKIHEKKVLPEMKRDSTVDKLLLARCRGVFLSYS